ncbi:MAG: hypothetical protein GY710_15705 [Desulfobacteraceae bacterium]|nr:hypothetical protein [Desulfobacteraceae bacterium]
MTDYFYTVSESTPKDLFFELLDEAAINVSVKQLRHFIENAPQAARQDPDFYYFKGFFAGRALHEDPEYFPEAPLEPLSELEKYIFDASDSVRGTRDYHYKVGYYDGRAGHEEKNCFGG